jgi:hypothetical protein
VATLIALERLEEVKPLANECYERQTKVFGPVHKGNQAVIEFLVELY